MGNREKSAILALVMLGVPLLAGAWLLGAPLWGFEAALFYVAPPVVASFVNWRWGLWLAFAYLPVEGIIYLSLNRPEALLFKDALLGAAYVGFFLRQGGPGRTIIPRQAITWPLFLLVVMYVVQIFNGGVPSLTVGLVGLRVLAYYIPLYYLAQHFVTSFDGLRRFLYGQLALSIPVSLFGLVQNLLGEQWWAGLGAGFYVWGVQSVYRVTSTFSFVGYFGAYTHLMIILAVALLPLARGPRERWFLVAALAANILGLLLNSQRSAMVALLVEVALVFLFLRRQLLANWLRAVLLGGGLVGLVLWLFPNLWYRTTTIFDLSEHTTYAAIRWGGAYFVVTQHPAALLLGYGTGTAVTALAAATGVPPFFWENWLGQVIWMFGVWGAMLYYGVLAYILVRVVRAVTSFPALSERWFATVIGAYLFWLLFPLFHSEGMYKTPDNIYVWFLLGALELLSRMVREQAAPVPTVAAARRPGRRARAALQGPIDALGRG